MTKNDLISIKQFCKHYNVPVTFINSLHEYELIEIIIENSDHYIHLSHINHIEKMMRLHYDLEINLEGLDAISNLLKQVESLKQELTMLNNKLKLYENLK